MSKKNKFNKIKLETELDTKANSETKPEIETESKIETKLDTREVTNFFIFFLSVYYNINNLEDCINWCNNNINQQIVTINRILDITWEVIIKPSDLANYETMDKLIKLYILIYKNKYKKDIEYHIMDKILRVKGKKLLSKNLLHYSNRSYQKKIKKYIYNNI